MGLIRLAMMQQLCNYGSFVSFVLPDNIQKRRQRKFIALNYVLKTEWYFYFVVYSHKKYLFARKILRDMIGIYDIAARSIF